MRQPECVRTRTEGAPLDASTSGPQLDKIFSELYIYIYINSTVLIFESFISLLCVVQDFCKNVNFPISTEMNLCFTEFLNKRTANVLQTDSRGCRWC